MKKNIQRDILVKNRNKRKFASDKIACILQHFELSYMKFTRLNKNYFKNQSCLSLYKVSNKILLSMV